MYCSILDLSSKHLLIYASKIFDFAKFSVFSITSGVAFALAKKPVGFGYSKLAFPLKVSSLEQLAYALLIYMKVISNNVTNDLNMNTPKKRFFKKIKIN